MMGRRKCRTFQVVAATAILVAAQKFLFLNTFLFPATSRSDERYLTAIVEKFPEVNITTSFIPAVQTQPYTLSLTRNFSGVVARAFKPWPADTPLPCYPAEKEWESMDIQFSPANEGFLYLKPYKTGSSTTSGVNLRIARNVARRQQGDIKICKTRFDHGPDFTPGTTLFKHRDPSKSFLWTILREPTSRAVSQFFHFEVSRKKLEPSDRNFKAILRRKNPLQDYYHRALYPRSKFSREENDPVAAANVILNRYNFIGITERLDESLVVLMMQLDLKIADILYLSAKGRGGYDDAGGKSNECTYIWPSFVSPGMREYFDSDEWKDNIKYDMLLYQAVNRSLDMTIDKLGRDKFNENLARFKDAQNKAVEKCLPTAVFPCDAGGRLHMQTDCLWNDSGCGATCLDEVATDLDLW
jgi:Galactose-3-O-sulfotransferase